MSLINYFFNAAIIITIQGVGLFLAYFFFKVLVRQELGWKILYYLFCFFSVLIVSSFGISSLLQYLFCEYEALGYSFVIRDGNSFVALLMEMAIFSAFLLTFPVGVCYLYMYLSSSLTLDERQQLNTCLIIFLYYYCLVFIIVDQDLSVSSWDVILSSGTLSTGLQLQPDLEFLFLSYRGEWMDFCICSFFEMLLFFSFYSGYYIDVWRKPQVHLLLLILHLLFTFYFFCGEGYLFDLLLLSISLFFFEILYFQLRFFLFLKMRKELNVRKFIVSNT